MKTQNLFELSLRAPAPGGLSDREIESALRSFAAALPDRGRILLLVPDYTRYHSKAGAITNILYHSLPGWQADILPALGTHAPMTREECEDMYGDIPFDRFIPHNWRTDVVKLGEVPGEFVSRVSGGVMSDPIDVEVNRRLTSGYDLILSIGQVVPHEVVGMANHSKNIFVGCGGSSMINSSHILGAFYGMERMMGRDFSPVRQVFDYAAERYLKELPITYILTVTTAPGGNVLTHGLFIGSDRSRFEDAVALAQEKNLIFPDHPIKKAVVYLDPKEFKSTWLGNKAVYRTRMAIADGGELIVLAPGVERFGEDPANDALIRKYGYTGRERITALCKTQRDLKDNLSAAAHLIHGSSDGRFSITYCTKKLSRAEIEGVGFGYLPYCDAAARYDPHSLADGFNSLSGGEEIFYISNPALGLWADKERFYKGEQL